MDKKILNEINRNREIMGLGQLIREAVDGKSVKIWLDSDGADSNYYIKEMMRMAIKSNLNNMTIPGYGDFYSALNAAFKKITGKEIVDENGEGTKAAFADGQFQSNIIKQKFSSNAASRYLILLGDNTGRFSSTELGLDKDTPTDVDQLIGMINKFNIDNAGSEQLYRASDYSAYRKQGNSTRILSKKSDNYIWLWSLDVSKSKRKIEGGEYVKGDTVAGDVINAKLGDSFENLQIVIKDKSEINDIKSQMA